MRTRTRIHPYVAPALAQRLHAYCGAKGLTESAAVQAAIEQYLDGGERDAALILRRLDRQAQASARVQRDVEVLSEAFAVYFRFWALHAPRYSAEETRAAGPHASKLFGEFIEIVSRELATGSHLASRVLKEDAGGADEPSRKPQATPTGSTGR